MVFPINVDGEYNNSIKPHEKMVHILLSVVVFSCMYYGLYLQNKKHFKQPVENEYPLKYENFLWYSVTLSFIIPSGDIYPLSGEAKLLSVIQSILFWYVIIS